MTLLAVLLVVAGVSPRPAADSTRLVVLGTGTPNPDPERSGPALAIVSGGRAYLVDAGPGIVRRAARAARDRGLPELDAARLDLVFITHLHSDHTVGLPDLLHTGWVSDRPVPLRVYGPPGIREMTAHLTAAWKEDIRIRTVGPQPSTKEGWKFVATVVKPGVVYRDSNLTVTAFSVSHTNWEHAFGYRFDARDRSIVVSGDTHPVEAVVRACHGCDLLVHEVYDPERLAVRPPEWRRYHAGSHTSASELAELATRARPRLLVLYHQLYWGGSDEDLVRQVHAGYSGAVVSAKDLEVYP
jgi:ribonuclease BN (tRNA processing enzyme)